MFEAPPAVVTELDSDQRQALAALLELVHYDDLAQSWYDMLPVELKWRPKSGRDLAGS